MPRGRHGHHGHHGRRHYGHHPRYFYRGSYPRFAYGYPAYSYPLLAYGAYPTFYSPVRTAYGSCDCNLNGYVTNNNCTQGVPVCSGGNCTCFNQASQTFGCFNQRGATC